MAPLFWVAWSGRLASRAEARGNQPAFAQMGFGAAALARWRERRLVGPERVERSTSRLSGVRSNHLSYEPDEVLS